MSDATADDAVYEVDFCLSSGLPGEALAVTSANPTNFHQAISDTDAMPRQDLWGKLFVLEGRGPFPVVIIVPGSLGLQQHHVARAEPLTDAGPSPYPRHASRGLRRDHAARTGRPPQFR